MFADVLVSQDADGQDVEESPVDDALVRERILQLDGANRSLIMLYGGDRHLAVGGDSDGGLVVYATLDGETFHSLTRDGADGDPPVTVVAGGQPGDYPANQVVSADAAISAAQEFARSGELADELTWEES
jgi:hypothetical protein